MIFKCVDCGHVFQEGDEHSWKEELGECSGAIVYETMSGCPICHGDYEEATKCEICDSLQFEDEIFGGVCEKCIEEHRRDFETCYNIGAKDEHEISINGLLATLFDETEIETILYNYIKEKCPDIDCGDFIYNDVLWFGEKLLEEVSK